MRSWEEYKAVVLDARLEWFPHASCIDIPKNVFFPAGQDKEQLAKKVCSSCPVQVECLEYALVYGEDYGIWGGTSEKDRRKLLKAVRKETARVLPVARDFCSSENSKAS